MGSSCSSQQDHKMKLGAIVLLVAFAAYGNCATLVGLGHDAIGHGVPVKCTVNCESAGPSVGPVVPSPLVNLLSGAGPLKPIDPPALPAAPAVEGEEAPAATAAALPWGPWNYGLYGHGLYGHGLYGHGLLGHGLWNNAHLLHPGVLAHPYAHGHGFYATGPVDVNADGAKYTGPEDDQSPIAGAHVYGAVDGATKWHGLLGSPAHFPALGLDAKHPWGYWGHPGVLAGVPAGKVPEGEEFNGPLYPYGHYANWHGLPWAHGLHHPLNADYLKALGLKPEDCPEGLLPHLGHYGYGHLPFVFDKSAKPVEAEAVAVADAPAEAAPAE